MYLKDLIKQAEKALEENGNIEVAIWSCNQGRAVLAEEVETLYIDLEGNNVDNWDIDVYKKENIIKVFEIV